MATIASIANPIGDTRKAKKLFGEGWSRNCTAESADASQRFVQVAEYGCPTGGLRSAGRDDDLYLIAVVRTADQCEVHSRRWRHAHGLEEAGNRKVRVAPGRGRFENESLEAARGGSSAQVKVAGCGRLADADRGRIEEDERGRDRSGWKSGELSLEVLRLQLVDLDVEVADVGCRGLQGQRVR